MDSSTSRFNGWYPVRLGWLVAAAAAAWALGALYSVKWNPETRYYAQGAVIKDQWAEKMTREHGAKIVVFGGSSCAFSIDGERMLDRFGLATVNYGRAASMGAAMMTESVLGAVRSGDTLIVAMEPALLTGPLDPPAEAVQFSFAVHHLAWVTHPVLGVGRVNWFQVLNELRPGGAHVFTLLGKLIGHKPLMRYQLADYRPSGFEQTAVRLPIEGPAGHGGRLSPDAVRLLGQLRAWCDQRHVRVAYSLPWSYTPSPAVQAFQAANARLLLQIVNLMPVLRDPSLGACTNRDFYSDTVWHLTEAGSHRRTDGLAEEIKNWDVWTPAALQASETQAEPRTPRDSASALVR